MNPRPNIVLVHGAWADGSCWSAVIERLQAGGYTVTAPQFPESSLADDVARLRQVLDRQDGPTIVAGHSYGGQDHDRSGRRRAERRRPGLHRGLRAGRGRIVGGLLAQGGPPTPALPILTSTSRASPGCRRRRPPLRGGRRPRQGTGHVRRAAAPVRVHVQDVMGVPTWKSHPSWFLVAENDQRSRPMPSGSSPSAWGPRPSKSRPADLAMVSHPDDVAQLIKTAAEAVQTAH